MKYQIPENAIILSIKEDTVEDDYSYEGLIIETDKGMIKLAISDSQYCCEHFGALFFETPDDTDQFIGARILSIEDISIKRDDYIKEHQETQLRITTDKGVIQYAIYNSHNGYYAHSTLKQVFESIEYDSL